MRVAIVGAGPAGLFLSILLKQADPAHEVVVHERNPADATFGFGVVFSESTTAQLHESDPVTLERIADASVRWQDIELRHPDRRVRIAGNGFSAIARKRLLLILQERAHEAGVDLRFESEVRADDLLGEFDIVLAADGVNSASRTQRQDAFGSDLDRGAAKYIWFATPQPFDALTMIFERNEHGSFGAHAYPFEDGTSTFIVETDAESWEASGLAAASAEVTAPGQSDAFAQAYFEQLYAEHLGGHGLLSNNSKWLDFNRIRARSWSEGGVVLMGDAAHTAHFSVGSGTKMAMEDAVALADELGRTDDVDSAVAAFEAVRRPRVEHIQRAALPSQIWWEEFRRALELPPHRFALHFMSRSFQITRGKIARGAGAFVAALDDELRAERPGLDPARPWRAPTAIGGLAIAHGIDLRADVVGGAGGRDAARGGAGLLSIDVEAVSQSELTELVAAGDVVVVARVRDSVSTEAAATSGAGVLEVVDDGSVGRALAAGDVEALLAATAERLAVATGWPADRPLLLHVALPADARIARLSDPLIGALGGPPSRPVDGIVVDGTASVEHDEGRQLALLLADRFRAQHGGTVVLAGAVRDADEAATVLLARRADVLRVDADGPSWWRSDAAELGA